jgi:hypothetical protein
VKFTLFVIPTLVTAGGRIVCRRCTARAKSTGVQCARPALKQSKTAKCGVHGGASTGARTTTGKARAALANTAHGTENRALRAERSRMSADLQQVEDLGRLVGLIVGPRRRGRRASGTG